jgi:hypothetical protein
MTKTEQPGTSPAGVPGDSAIEQKLVQFAEQLGFVVGTIQAKADGWLDRDSLRSQITTVRDAAAELLKHVAAQARAGRTRGRTTTVKKKKAAVRADPAHAPGKKHRKPAPGPHGVKKSDKTIANLRVAGANRKRRQP